MLVKRVSDLTGIEHEMEIPIAEWELEDYEQSNICIQEYFPNLTPEQREFILSGSTTEEWDELFDFEMD